MPSPQNMAFHHTLSKTRLLPWLSYLLDFILYNSVLATIPQSYYSSFCSFLLSICVC